MDDHDDDADVELAQNGDQQAFARLVDRYWGRIFRWLGGLMHDAQAVEDLTQETFLRAWKALPSFRLQQRFRPWLFAIARHCFVDGWRSSRGKAVQPLPDNLPGRDSDPLTSALRREGEGMLTQACSQLPVHFRSAYLLWAQESLSFPEIARVLGIKESTARWRVFKARHLLVQQLGAYLDERTL